jgi:gamma-glutamylcyclotransferase (GGCT)/AIG2-like uncharacterized protein YtfP
MAVLFVYGTLQHPPLLGRLIGRVPEMTPAELPRHRAAPLTGRVYPGLLRDDGATAAGRLLLDVADDEVAVLDAFEGPEYRRAAVVATTSGGDVPCEVWLLTGPSSRLALPGSWSFERFLADDVSAFLGGSVAGQPHPGAGP